MKLPGEGEQNGLSTSYYPKDLELYWIKNMNEIYYTV